MDYKGQKARGLNWKSSDCQRVGWRGAGPAGSLGLEPKMKPQPKRCRAFGFLMFGPEVFGFKIFSGLKWFRGRSFDELPNTPSAKRFRFKGFQAHMQELGTPNPKTPTYMGT